MLDDAFCAIHSDLSREGPGHNASTADFYGYLSVVLQLP